MLSWLKGDKVDHPLANAKELKRVLNALPGKDPVKTAEDATHWLGTINETEAFKIEQRFALIDSFDMATRRAQGGLREAYARLVDGDRVQEKRLWKVASDFWAGLGEAYLSCARQALDAKNVPGAFKSRVPLMAARATRALRYQMHCVLVRYGVMRGDFWADVALCTQVAEASGGAETLIDLYPDGSGASSQRYEFLRTMMFWAASPSGLSPTEQDIAERLVAYHTAKFRIGNQYWEGCDYCFDLRESRPPLRCMAGAAPGDSTRYFDSGDAWQAIQAQNAQVAATQTAPEGINWSGATDVPAILRVLNHIGLNWAKEMPARASLRRKTAMRLLVVHGYQNVLGAIEPAISEGLDFSDSLAHDTWIAEDVSAGGYGVVVPAGKGEWLRVGTLVALRSETEAAWELGIVRRVKSDDHRQHRVGIQLISKSATLVHLRKVSGAGQGGKRQVAILLAARPSRTGSLHVVARRDLFDGRDSLEATYGNPATSVTFDPGGVVEIGQDFDWLRYKLLNEAV